MSVHGKHSRCFPQASRVSDGRDLEEKLLGRKATKEGLKEYFNLRPSLLHAGVSRENFFDWARWNQPIGWNPFNPSIDMARTFFNAVKSQLRKDLRNELCMYVAVDTPLDFDPRYRTDFWLECRGQKITFNVTVNPDKKHARVVDFFLHVWKATEGFFFSIARSVSKLLMRKLRSANIVI